MKKYNETMLMRSNNEWKLERDFRCPAELQTQ
jgi:hypothetical protein